MTTDHPGRILITGATGFIGGRLARALADDGWSVRATGRDARKLADLDHEGCEAAPCDLRDAGSVARICDGIDVVCHAGAYSSPWGSREDFLETNVQGTRNLLEACRRCGVRRCIYLSSPSVTSGDGDIENEDETAVPPRRAISAYSHSKRLAEDEVVKVSQSSLETVVLRPKAVFGPGDTAILPRLLRAASQNRLRQIGSGNNLVDLTHVDNVVHAIRLAMERRGVQGRVFLITNDEHPSLWQVVRRVCRELGHNDQFGSMPYTVALTAATMMETRASILGGEPMLTRNTVKM